MKHPYNKFNSTYPLSFSAIIIYSISACYKNPQDIIIIIAVLSK